METNEIEFCRGFQCGGLGLDGTSLGAMETEISPVKVITFFGLRDLKGLCQDGESQKK